MNIKLGQKVKDSITGFTGIATAHVKYLTGCDQIGVTPPVDKEGKCPDTAFFDHTRLKAVGKALIKPTNQTVGGPNRDCPRS